MKWHKPEVIEKEVGLEVTAYSPAELDRDWKRPPQAVRKSSESSARRSS
jgi:coenzyme PQQ precursor peptide PqqA